MKSRSVMLPAALRPAISNDTVAHDDQRRFRLESGRIGDDSARTISEFATNHLHPDIRLTIRQGPSGRQFPGPSLEVVAEVPGVNAALLLEPPTRNARNA